MSDEDTKEILKEAIREWLDDQFATFGKWSLGALVSSALVAIAYLILVMDGWHK